MYSVRMQRLTTSERIAKAARRLLEKRGAAGVSIRPVARAVGLSTMAIYRHFPNREALLHRVVDDCFAESAAKWATTANITDVRLRLVKLIDSYIDFAFEYPHAFDYSYSVRRNDARRFPDDFRAGLSPTGNLVADVVADGMSRGQLRKDDVWDVTMSIWSHIHGLVCLYRGGRFNFTDGELRAFCHASLRRLLDGLCA